MEQTLDECKANEVYRGYTIVTMIPTGVVRLIDADGEYVSLCGKPMDFDLYDNAKAHLDARIRYGYLPDLSTMSPRVEASALGLLQLIVPTDSGNITVSPHPMTTGVEIAIEGCELHLECVNGKFILSAKSTKTGKSIKIVEDIAELTNAF